MASDGRARRAITPDFEDWGAINQKEGKRLASKTELALSIRIFFAALARANRIGHAEFRKDELTGFLVTRRRDDAAVATPSRQQVWQAIRRAKELELLDDESRLRCLVLPIHLWDKGVGGTTCVEHGLGGRWSPPRC
ncbi:hypothetical protein [Nocardioides abyssi]|uniref:Core-binding (CB) domain-containing protein n=1 Tax=Nocardioides abyssi TaxID=3058370 RepID=A0ABT8EYU7_9ACTN|nr:hypothetical protein [Nocardioides abyssi]MDN4163357.1 hypothetical protein [Nocardioides abyssi]